MSGKFQYSRYERLGNHSDSDAPSTVSIRSEPTGQRLTDLSWAGGLLDGEGCFRASSTPTISVESTSKNTVERLHELFKGTCSAEKRRTASGRQVFRWRIYGKNAVEVCESVLPYLVEKQKQAELITSFYRYPTRSAMRRSISRRLSKLKRTV